MHPNNATTAVANATADISDDLGIVNIARFGSIEIIRRSSNSANYNRSYPRPQSTWCLYTRTRNRRNRALNVPMPIVTRMTNPQPMMSEADEPIESANAPKTNPPAGNPAHATS